MRITIELDSADIERFMQALARSRRTAIETEEPDILDAARHALDSLPISTAPSYVRKRIGEVQRLIAMLEDEAWALPAPWRIDVLEVLVYFSDPEDLIPDHIEVIGLLDDAIMLELLLRKLAPAMRAYADFGAYRESLGTLPREPVARHEYAIKLARRRDALRLRLQRSAAAKRRRSSST
jgi:hypothetical protein